MFVWAHRGQAPEEMTLGLAFFPLPWHSLPGQPSCQLPPSCSPTGWLRVGINNKNPSGVQGVSPASQGTLQSGYGSRAQRGRGAAWRGAQTSCATANWKCSLWEAAAKEGEELSLS